MQNVLIVGAGTGGSILLDLLRNLKFIHVEAIIDTDENAPGIMRAKALGVNYGKDWASYIHPNLDVIIDVTGEKAVFTKLLEKKSVQTVIIPGTIANLLVRSLEENDSFMQRIQTEVHKQRMIFDSVEEGMIGINERAKIDFFNRRAAEMTGIPIEDAIGKNIGDVIPKTKLPFVLKTGEAALNQELTLGNGLKIVTSRLPLLDEHGKKVGAFAVFKDLTEVRALAEEITDLKKIQTMLEAIIHSSDDAISVVDEKGNGLLVNPAYSRITGLTEADVIGKPATADISEGESIHMKVLKTGQAVRGVKMCVGDNKNDVIVNVAPIIVNEKIRGSVGVLHDVTEMRQLMEELDRAKAIIRALESTYTFDDIYGTSTDIMLSIEQAKLAAQNEFSVLLRGEAGTGKELFANAIHSEGSRKQQPFIRVNCSAIDPSLLESTLFGHYENQVWQAGLLKEADKGTLFLDEVTDLPLKIQQKLLHYLQTGEIYPLGSDEPLQIDVRLITSTAENLEKAIHQGIFKEKLYYVLNRISIQIPPLRNRKEDISTIVSRLLVKLNEEFGMHVDEVTEEARALLTQYDWPGNSRELENVLNRAMIYMHQSESKLGVEAITRSLYAINGQPETATVLEKSSLGAMMDDYEKSVIEKALREQQGNKSLTASRLGISLRSLYYKLEKFDLL